MSLRDVERAMQVMVWFYKHVDTLGRLMKIVITKQRKQEGEEVDDNEEDKVILVSWFDSLTPHLLQKRNLVFVLRLLYFSYFC